MVNPTAEMEVRASELLFYLSGAFRNGVEGGFLQREHASAIFKSALRDLGYEITKKETEKGGAI